MAILGRVQPVQPVLLLPPQMEAPGGASYPLDLTALAAAPPGLANGTDRTLAAVFASPAAVTRGLGKLLGVPLAIAGAFAQNYTKSAFSPSGSEIAVASATITLNPAAAGNIYVLFSAGWTGGGSGSTPIPPTSVSGGNCTWTVLGTGFTNSSNKIPAFVGLGAFLGVATGTGSSAATVSFGGSPGNVRTVAQQFSVSASASLDGTVVLLDAVASNSTMPSLTPSAAGELYIGYEINSGTSVGGSTPGYTYQVDGNGNGLVYNPSCGTGAQAPVWGSTGCEAGLALLLQGASQTAVILAAVVAVPALVRRSAGRLLSGVTALAGLTRRSASRGLVSAAALTSSAARSVARSLTAMSAAAVALSMQKVKLLSLIAAVAAITTVTRGLGKPLGVPLATAGALARGITRSITAVTAVIASLVLVKVKLLSLAAVAGITGGARSVLGKMISVVTAVTALTSRNTGKHVAAPAGVSAVLARSTGKVISAVTAVVAGASLIKVKLLSLAAGAAALAGVTRRVGQHSAAQAAVTAGAARNVTRILAAPAAALGQAARGAGKKLSAVAAAVSAFSLSKVRLIAVAAVTAVTTGMQRRVGSVQTAAVAVTTSMTRRISRAIAGNSAIAAVFTAGRALTVYLSAIISASAGAVTKLITSAFLIIFRFGLPVLRWVTGTVKRGWRIP